MRKQKASAAAESSANLSALRDQITNLVAVNALCMVQHVIDAANEQGQYQAIKYLFEMIGLYPAVAQDQSIAQESLVRTLLQHLGLPEVATDGHEAKKSQRSIP